MWPYYAPILGVVAVLLTTNLSAHLWPGQPSAWVGVLAPSTLSVVVAWRGGAHGRVSKGAALRLTGLATAAAGLFVFALANRLHFWFIDESWHFALAQRMAKGEFPPVTPYGIDAGIGYHYGADLLAASVMNITDAPVWTVYYVLLSFLTVALILAAIGFAWDVGSPLPLAVGAGVALGLFGGDVHVGLPPYVEASGDDRGLAGFIGGLAPAETENAATRVAFDWVDQPQWALAAAIVILIAASLETAVARRQAAVLAAAAGVSALAEAAVLVFSGAALGLVGIVRFFRPPAYGRFWLVAALATSALLIALAGGPIADAVLGRGGTTGMVRIEFDPDPDDLAPFELAGPALIQVGVIPLVVIGAFAAVRRRSWGLAYLTLAGTLGLVEAETLRSVRPANDDRILWLATAVAMFTALVGISVLVGALSRPRQRLAVFAIGLLALLPAVVPRAISGTQLALGGLSVGHLAGTDSVDRSAVRTQFGLILEANWDFYAWLARSLSTDARLLTTQPAAIASLAGIASPTSGRHLQSLAQYATPTYEDALRFLHRDDLQEMGITHLHVTDDHAAALTPEARRLLDNPAHFKLLTDQHSASGQRHRLFEVLPGAGTSDVALSSYRRLRQIVPVETPVTLVGGLSVYARRMLLFNFIDHLDLRAPESTDVNRATRVARFRTDLGISDQGVVVLPESLEPTALGLSADDAFWTGYGTRAYRPSDTWSSVWRVGSDVGGLPGDLVPLCEAADGTLEFQVLGAPGTPVAAGSKTWDLTGVPQQFRLSVPDCGALAIVADADIAPFARVRASQPASLAKRDRRVAGLGFDGHVEGEHLVVNLWYQNPHRIAFDAEAHLRLYEADATGTVPALPDFIRFARRWDRPLVLTRDSQMARIEFDARRLEINGSEGGGWVSRLAPGRSYVLMLTVAEYDPASEHVDFHQLLPLARVDVRDAKVDYQVFSGIVALRHLAAGSSAISRLQAHHGWLGVDMDLTPPRAAGSENP